MGYDTNYTITITADTKERRREIASAIIRCAWLPYQDRKLEKGEFKDPVLSFQNRGWRDRGCDLLDLSGMWYDYNERSVTAPLGIARGVSLKEGESVMLYGRGDDDKDVYRIFATHTSITRQMADVEFVNREAECPNDDAGCEGCQGCATTAAHFSDVVLVDEDKEF